jgi:hypothetical protein
VSSALGLGDSRWGPEDVFTVICPRPPGATASYFDDDEVLDLEEAYEGVIETI